MERARHGVGDPSVKLMCRLRSQEGPLPGLEGLPDQLGSLREDRLLEQPVDRLGLDLVEGVGVKLEVQPEPIGRDQVRRDHQGEPELVGADEGGQIRLAERQRLRIPSLLGRDHAEGLLRPQGVDQSRGRGVGALVHHGQGDSLRARVLLVDAEYEPEEVDQGERDDEGQHQGRSVPDEEPQVLGDEHSEGVHGYSRRFLPVRFRKTASRLGRWVVKSLAGRPRDSAAS